MIMSLYLSTLSKWFYQVYYQIVSNMDFLYKRKTITYVIKIGL